MENGRLVFESDGVEIRSSLDAIWDPTILKLKSLDYEGAWDWVVTPWMDYPEKDWKGNPLDTILFQPWESEETPSGPAYGGNPSFRYYEALADRYRVGDANSTGLDIVLIDQTNPDGSIRDDNKRLLTTMVHEILHESDHVRDMAIRAAKAIVDSYPAGSFPNDLPTEEIYQASEHLIITHMLIALVEKNRSHMSINGQGYLDEYNNQLNQAITDAGVQGVNAENWENAYTVFDLVFESVMSDSSLYSSNINALRYNEDGSVSTYINEQGDKVEVGKGYYTENMLNLYGRETVDSEGNTTASMTLGGTLRALADWLGFDGKVGIQGGFANDKEGSDKEPVDAAKPVVLDMDGDGIEVSLDYQASFDYDGDGFRERTAWVSADDAFLVVDLNADGSFGAGDVSDVSAYGSK